MPTHSRQPRGDGSTHKPEKTGCQETGVVRDPGPHSMSAQAQREVFTPPGVSLAAWLARMYRHKLTTTSGGNLSVVDAAGTVFVTPRGGDKALIAPSDVSSLAGAVPELCERWGSVDASQFIGEKPPSTEWPLHLACYAAGRRRHRASGSSEAVGAVLHAHSQTLVAFSLAAEARERLPDTRLLLSAFAATGQRGGVALAPYALPGSSKLAESCAACVEQGACSVILQNHGVVCVAPTLGEAFDRFVALEFLARATMAALPLGPPRPLSDQLIGRLLPTKTDGEAIEEIGATRIQACACEKDSHCSAAFPVTSGENAERLELSKFVQRAYDQGIITASSGSFSHRVDVSQEGMIAFVVTPTGVDRGTLSVEDLVLVTKVTGEDPRFHARGSKLRPSRAARIHAAIFEQHVEATCVMIAQPPSALAYCITHQEFDAAGIPESHIVLRHVSSLEAEAVLDAGSVAGAIDLGRGRHTLLVNNYGAITVGHGTLRAFDQLEVLEAMCSVTLTALSRGAVKLLTDSERTEVEEAFLS
jgi:ribulose-5-phosphate 4-epimerase/fuculose-1-phosphate aldolase